MTNHPKQTAHSEWGRDIAANVRAEAAGRGYNQSDLGRFLRQDRSTVGLKWRGIREWSLADLETLSNVFGLAPWDLVTVDERTRARRDLNPQPADLEFIARCVWAFLRGRPIPERAPEPELAAVLPFPVANSARAAS